MLAFIFQQVGVALAASLLQSLLNLEINLMMNLRYLGGGRIEGRLYEKIFDAVVSDGKSVKQAKRQQGGEVEFILWLFSIKKERLCKNGKNDLMKFGLNAMAHWKDL